MQGSSQALGLLVAIIALCSAVLLGFGMSPRQEGVVNAASLSLILIIFIGAHSTVAALQVEPGFERAMSSAALLGLVIIGGAILRNTFFGLPEADLGRATALVRFFFLAAAVLAIAGFQPLTNSVERPVFPYTEPSHFALAFTPFLIQGAVQSRGWRRAMTIGIALLIAYALKSLSLVVGVAIAAVISLQLWALAVGVVAVVTAVTFVDVTYFTDRLVFDPNNQNLSQLVWLQGWELLSSSLKMTSGWGIGFQNLGFAPVDSPTANQIYRLLNNDSNLKDGGFIAAKLVSEFGIFGIAGLAGLATMAVRACLRLRAVAVSGMSAPDGMVLAWSFMAGALVELFVRGIGYFSPTTLFYAAAVGYVVSSGKNSASMSKENKPPHTLEPYRVRELVSK